MMFHLNEIPELLASHIRIRDVAEVEKKIASFYSDGKDHLQIIADFDGTLTYDQANLDLRKITHGVFAFVEGMPNTILKEGRMMYKRVIEVAMDENLTKEEKNLKMDELWKMLNQLYIGIQFNNKLIEDAIISSEIRLRKGVEGVMKELKENNVPVLILSAGLGDVISSILKLNNIHLDNIQIIANFFFVKDEKIVGFKGKNITLLNKNQRAIDNCDYFKKLSHRENVILLGDAANDANMDEGIKGNSSVLKIGFLSRRIEEDLAKFMELFDIVLLDDSSFDVFNAILKKILNNK